MTKLRGTSHNLAGAHNKRFSTVFVIFYSEWALFIYLFTYAFSSLLLPCVSKIAAILHRLSFCTFLFLNSVFCGSHRHLLTPISLINWDVTSLTTPCFHYNKLQETCMIKNVLKRLYMHAQVPEHKMLSPTEQ